MLDYLGEGEKNKQKMEANHLGTPQNYLGSRPQVWEPLFYRIQAFMKCFATPPDLVHKLPCLSVDKAQSL